MKNHGTILRIARDKGFGFLAADETGTEFFFHATGVTGSFEELTEGDTVSFTIEPSLRGPRAYHITLVTDPR
jgi:cold shock CspA family protein